MQRPLASDDQAGQVETSSGSSQQMLPFLVGAASAVVVMWGIRQASQGYVIISLLLAETSVHIKAKLPTYEDGETFADCETMHDPSGQRERFFIVLRHRRRLNELRPEV